METRTFRFQLLIIVGLIVATLWSPHSLQAVINIKLNGVMPPFGVVASFQISPDGRYAVYLADQDTSGVTELYSVFLGGGSPVRLNPILSLGRNVTSFQISPDSSRVVYRGNQDTAAVFELYSVPIGGPAGIKLNRALVAFGNVVDFKISPDSSRVIYYADQEMDNVSELYSVPLKGPATAGIKLNVEVGALGNVEGLFQISPDSTQVVYQAHQQNVVINDFELYSVPLKGPAAAGIILNGAPGALRKVSDFRISPDSGWVVYQVDQQTPTVLELYSVPLGGPAAAGVKLNRVLPPGGNVTHFNISPDSSRVVYNADQEKDNDFELYSVPLGGPATAGIKLNGVLGPGGGVNGVGRISPDSSRVVYTAIQEAATAYDLYSVPLGGPAADGIKLNRPLFLNGEFADFEISPDSSRVVYTAAQDTVGVQELYSVPLAGPEAAGIKLNGATAADGSVFDLKKVARGFVFDFRISPDSGRAVYRSNQETDTVIELYSVPLGGPAAAGIKLNGTLVTGGFVNTYQISPDSGRVVYTAIQDTAGVLELYMTSFSFLYLPLILNQG
jgi:Tol biopolymer transport system component